MKLKDLADGIEHLEIKSDSDIEVMEMTEDSRSIKPQSLFVARRGSSFDANQFIIKIAQAGASAVLTDSFDPSCLLPQLIHPHPQEVEALLASRLYNYPSLQLCTIGVTGTNGKTTSTYLIKHLLDQKGISCALSGTVESVIQEKKTPSLYTTQDVISNQKFLQESLQAGCKACVLEVSSHGLVQHRLDEIAFDMALFTNLTPDHLDYHQDIEQYLNAKKHLFDLLDRSPKNKKYAIVNGDDPRTKDLISSCKAKKLSFGLGENVDLRAESIAYSASGTSFFVQFRGQTQVMYSPLIGEFNVYNVLGAIAVGLCLNYPLEELSLIFGSFNSVPGRLERIVNNRGIHVFVDYAHTEDALTHVLATLRSLGTRRILLVFGAGGGRDPGRRSGLARAAEKGADLAIITSDNPRKEDPEKICDEILASFVRKDLARKEIDRKKAIELAIKLARPGDIVLVAGKGHEQTQVFANYSVIFDDRKVARDALFSGGV